MENLQLKTKEEIDRIFEKNLMKLRELAEKLDEGNHQSVDKKSNNSIGKSLKYCKRL